MFLLVTCLICNETGFCFYVSGLCQVLVQALRKARQRSDEDLFSGTGADEQRLDSKVSKVLGTGNKNLFFSGEMVS